MFKLFEVVSQASSHATWAMMMRQRCGCEHMSLASTSSLHELDEIAHLPYG